MTLNEYYATITYDEYLQHSSLKEKAQNFAKSVKDTGLRNTLKTYGSNLGHKYIKKIKTANNTVRYIYDTAKDRVKGAAKRFKEGYNEGGKTVTSRAYNLGSALGSVFNKKKQTVKERLRAARQSQEEKKRRMNTINSAPSGQTWYV